MGVVFRFQSGNVQIIPVCLEAELLRQQRSDLGCGSRAVSNDVQALAVSFKVVVDTTCPFALVTLNVTVPGLPIYNRALCITTGMAVVTFTAGVNWL